MLGDPAPYRRFGFASGSLTFDDAPAMYVQHLVLDGGDAPTGEIRYAPAFTDGGAA